MSAQTPIYGITYPTGDDLVRGLPEQLQSAAQTTEAALNLVDKRATPEGAAPVIAQTYDQLSHLPGVTGQTGYVTNDASYRNGVYIHDIAGWERASDTLGDDLFEFVDNDGWRHEYRAWLGAGTVFLNLRMIRKQEWNPGTGTQAIEKIGNIKIPAFRPPFFVHIPGFSSGTTNDNCNAFGIRVDPSGELMAETFMTNAGLRNGGTIQAMMTWPCTWH